MEEIPVPGTLYSSHCVDVLTTAFNGVKIVGARRGMVRRVVEILKNFDPQLVPTAYHFFTSNAIRTLGIPCISIDHQHSLTKHELNIPGEQSFSRLLFQIPLRYMYGKADLHFVSSLFPLSPVSPAEDVGVENISAFFCGFKTVRLFEKKNIEHIRTPWADDPATAAWLTSKLTGILFRELSLRPCGEWSGTARTRSLWRRTDGSWLWNTSIRTGDTGNLLKLFQDLVKPAAIGTVYNASDSSGR